jgi:hypothetical protein
MRAPGLAGPARHLAPRAHDGYLGNGHASGPQAGRGSEESRSSQGGRAALPSWTPPASDILQFNERIDGREAKLSRNRLQQTYYIGAQWDTPAIWITGETSSSDAADLVLNIARTVRFVAN